MWRKVSTKQVLYIQQKHTYHLCLNLNTAQFSASPQCGDDVFVLAAEAVNAIGLLSKSPMASEDKLLVSENAASNLLSLAAQIALEVRLISGLMTVTVHQSERSCNI